MSRLLGRDVLERGCRAGVATEVTKHVTRPADRKTLIQLGLEPDDCVNVTLRVEAVAALGTLRHDYSVASFPAAQRVGRYACEPCYSLYVIQRGDALRIFDSQNKVASCFFSILRYGS